MITPIKLLPPPNTLSHNTLHPILIYFGFFSSQPHLRPPHPQLPHLKLWHQELSHLLPSKTYLNSYDLTEFFAIPKIMLNPTKLLPPPFTPSDNTPFPHPLLTHPQIYLQTNFRVAHSTLPQGNSWYTSNIDINTYFTVSSLRSNMMIYDKDNPMLHVSYEEPLTYSK